MSFKKGVSGNPKGRPRGALGKHKQFVRLLEPHAEELVNKVVELAKSGDINALRLCVERLIPKVSPVTFSNEEECSKEKECVTIKLIPVASPLSD